MAGMFIKLDYDWLKDPKVRNFKKQSGKAGLVDLIQLFILMSRHKGLVDLNDYGVLEDAKDVMGMNEQRLKRFLDLAADCDVINAEFWQVTGKVSSSRAVKDAKLREARSSAGQSGGELSKRGKSKKNE